MRRCCRQPPLNSASLTHPDTRSVEMPQQQQNVAVSCTSACSHTQVRTYHATSGGATPGTCTSNAEDECPIQSHTSVSAAHIGERGTQLSSPVLQAEASSCRHFMANTSLGLLLPSSSGHSWIMSFTLNLHTSAPSHSLKKPSFWSAANLPRLCSPSHRCTRAADHLLGFGLASLYTVPCAAPVSALQLSNMP